VAICGGVPREWTDRDEGSEASRQAAVLHVSAREDPFYPLDRVAGFRATLAARFGEVSHLLCEGGHRIPSALLPRIRAFLQAKG